MNNDPPADRFRSLKPKAGRVDVVVGARLRLRRQTLGMTQGELAAALNIAQQQLQKYEAGQNRISAARLYEAAKILKAPITWFYEELDHPQENDQRQSAEADPSPLSDGQIAALLRLYADGPGGRERLLEMLMKLVGSPSDN